MKVGPLATARPSPVPRTSLKTKKPLKPIHYRYVPCKACGEVSAMPLKQNGKVGTRGAAWAYTNCPFCKKARI